MSTIVLSYKCLIGQSLRIVDNTNNKTLFNFDFQTAQDIEVNFHDIVSIIQDMTVLSTSDHTMNSVGIYGEIEGRRAFLRSLARFRFPHRIFSYVSYGI